jgi:predicted alpha/beta hydrolase
VTDSGQRILALVVVVAAVATPACAQAKKSERGSVGQTVAGTTITVEYSRPKARGRSLFGGVVKWGEHWTPGADWATTVEVDHDVTVEGERLPKGKYGVWTVVQPDQWTVGFHREWRRFHTNRPDSTDEALRLTVRPDSGPPVELLTFDFPEVDSTGATLRFRWGPVVVPLRIGLSP